MKTTKLILIAMIAFLPFANFAQNSVVGSLFDKYSGNDGFTSVDISSGLFQLFAEIEADDPEFDDFKKAVNGIESMRLLAYSAEDEKNSVEGKNEFYDNIMKTFPFDQFKELMVVRDKDAKINFYAKHEKQMISEMIMIVNSDDEAVLMSLFGNIDLNAVAKLGSTMDIGGMEYLGKMEKEEK